MGRVGVRHRITDFCASAGCHPDPAQRRATRGGRELALTAKEFALLEHLTRSAGQVVSRADLVVHLWDDSHLPYSNLVDVYVSRLRRKIEDEDDYENEHELQTDNRSTLPAGFLDDEIV